MASQQRLHATLRVAAKELRETLRDRQTAFTTLVLPICMYPVLFWVMVQGFLVLQGQKERTEVRVGVINQESVPEDLLRALDKGQDEDEEYQANRLVLVDLGAQEDVPRAELLEPQGEDSSPGDPPLAGVLSFAPQGAQLHVNRSEPKGELTEGRITSRLARHVDQLREQAAQEGGYSPTALEPLRLERKDVGPESDKGALILAMLLPMLLVTMCVMGAFFPAVDLSAGERERGTAETTLLLPIPRLWVLQGKVLAVASLSMIATSFNLLALGISAEGLLATLLQGSSITINLPWQSLLAIAPLTLLFALFAGATLTAISGLARNFKEAQAMLGPVQLLFIMPAIAGIMPGIDLTPGLALVPVLNMTLAAKSMLLGKILPLEYTLVAISLLISGWLALNLAVRLLSREAFATSSATIPLRKLVSFLRSDGDASR
ncbi:MAG TPA: ABC transporter permease [Planctomycetes bacterium]|nr:ABC transporter permease [Planctomycetota bacterium]HIL37376.1 ABC transporter permease [Planctomycetota bacterium]